MEQSDVRINQSIFDGIRKQNQVEFDKEIVLDNI